MLLPLVFKHGVEKKPLNSIVIVAIPQHLTRFVINGKCVFNFCLIVCLFCLWSVIRLQKSSFCMRKRKFLAVTHSLYLASAANAVSSACQEPRTRRHRMIWEIHLALRASAAICAFYDAAHRHFYCSPWPHHSHWPSTLTLTNVDRESSCCRLPDSIHSHWNWRYHICSWCHEKFLRVLRVRWEFMFFRIFFPIF